MNEKPSESLLLSTVDCVKSEKEKSFYVQIKNKKYHFKASSKYIVEEWVHVINKYINQCIKIPITIECARDNEFNDEIKLVIPYNGKYKYTLNELICVDLMKYIEQKHSPLRFNLTPNRKSPFNSKSLETIITNYDPKSLGKAGICLDVDINVQSLNVLELMPYFKIIQNKFQIFRHKYIDILSCVIQQIIKKLKLMQKPLDLDMLQFGFANNFISFSEINKVALELSANELSKLIKKIGDQELSKYVFQTENKAILSHYHLNDLFILLTNHYSNTFAIFVFQQFKPHFFVHSVSKRMKFLHIASVAVLISVYEHNNIGKRMDIPELKYLFVEIKQYITTHNKITHDLSRHLNVLSLIIHQIAATDAVFLSDSLYFIFHETSVELKTIITRISADCLSKTITTINDENITKYVFEDKSKECLARYTTKDLTKLLETYYSKSFAIFVFESFSPSFLKSPLLQRLEYLKNLTLEMLVWVFYHDDIGKKLHIREFQSYFKMLKKYARSPTMQPVKDEYYSILGVDKRANLKTIKKAYRYKIH